VSFLLSLPGFFSVLCKFAVPQVRGDMENPKVKAGKEGAFNATVLGPSRLVKWNICAYIDFTRYCGFLNTSQVEQGKAREDAVVL
jgi:hypothetical protein